MKTATTVMLTLLSTLALAHGGGDHLMGTVKTIDEKSITLTTQDGKEVTASLTAETKFERDGKPASAKDAAAGDRVVVHTAKKDASAPYTANLVKLSSKKAGP